MKMASVTRHWIYGYFLYRIRFYDHRRICSPSFKIFTVLMLLACFCLFKRFYNIHTLIVRYSQEYQDSSNSTCYIPSLNPFDQTISHFFTDFPAQDCRKDTTDYDLVYVDHSGFVQFNKSVLARLSGKPDCVYHSVRRQGDSKVDFAEPKTLALPQIVPSDFFRVHCKISGYLIYSRVLSSIYPPHNSSAIFKRTGVFKKFNVLIFGVDSLSHITCLRKLPKTRSFLKKTLHSLELGGFNQVWDNTYGNVLPLLTGLSQSENPSRSIPPDKYDLIWKKFTANGYATLFAEDRPTSISLFNYVGPGFTSQPVHHYMRPFWLAIEKEHPVKMKISPVVLAFEHGVRLRQAISLCYKSKTNVKIMTDYTSQFFRRYSKYPKFAFTFLSSPGHDHMNMIQVLDDDIHSMLRTLNDEGHLKDTFVFFMGDHGHRFDLIRRTLVGQIEQRSPYLAVSLPTAFITNPAYRQARENFMANQHRLSTPYDVYETLVDILDGRFNHSNVPVDNDASKSHGLSLFRRISPSRTCLSASIPREYCACFTSKPVSSLSVRHILKFVSHQTSSFANSYNGGCKSEVTFERLLSASLKQPGQNLMDLDTSNTYFFHSPVNQVFEYYVLKFRLKGSNDAFEVTVKYSLDSLETAIVGDIIRHSYGGQVQSRCTVTNEMSCISMFCP